MHPVVTRAASGQLVIIDGGTGTELEKRGVPMDSAAWSARAALTHPEILKGIHLDYIHAGAELIIANTYSASHHVLEQAGFADEFETINIRSVEIAREAAGMASESSPSGAPGQRAPAPGAPVAVAGSVSTTTFTGPGSLDYGVLPTNELAVPYYTRHANLLRDAGVDCIILEMMRDHDQTLFALEGALESGLPVWVGFSVERDEDGGIEFHGGAKGFFATAKEAAQLGPQALGIMHSQIEDTPESLRMLREIWSGPLFAYPHRGVFEMPHWRFTDTISPAAFAAAAEEWRDAGATILGGCCGIGPEHIAALSVAAAGWSSGPPR
jgi:homocysteine S-methyltransferase